MFIDKISAKVPLKLLSIPVQNNAVKEEGDQVNYKRHVVGVKDKVCARRRR